MICIEDTYKEIGLNKKYATNSSEETEGNSSRNQIQKNKSMTIIEEEDLEES